MRYSLITLVAVGLVSGVFGRPTPTPSPPKPPVIEKEGLICRTKQQDAELRDWIVGIQTLAAQAVGEAQEAKKSNLDLQDKLLLASDDGIKLAKENDQLKLDIATILKKLHFWKWLGSGLVVAAVVFGALNLPPPFSFYVMAGGSTIGVLALWIWF